MTDLAGFVALAIVVIVTPGPDTALTIRNTLVGGRPAGIATAVGVALGQATWSLATSVGVSALLVAAEPAFAALKLAGAAYLIYLGGQSLWSAYRGRPAHETVDAAFPRVRTTNALRQGVLSNLTNPKMAVFFPSLLPQFVSGDAPPFLPLFALGILFCLMTLTWLTGYAFAVARAGDVLRRSALRRAIEAVTGVVLIAFGLRVAVAPR
ncbi:MAG TPA: LysE family translocator [Candidatus Bathyarchaeia archaeon]|nr:LysE family translocator [Candidatus Bathyarchaeia archaeon]